MLIDFKMNAQHFKNTYQEKNPILIKDAFNSGYVNWDDINQIITRVDASSINFRVSSKNGNVPKNEYVDSYSNIGILHKKLNKPALYKLLKEGATVVANCIFDEPKFNDYAKEIAQFTGRQTLTSTYIAFGDQDSYRAHWDTRDVFAVQLIGKKKWILHPPSLEMPLYMQQSKDFEKKYPCPSYPVSEFILEEGDILYIPRGWWHNPSPMGVPTVHLAIGTFPAFAFDYIRSIIKYLPEIKEAREAFENLDKDREIINTLADKVSELIKDPNNYHNFIEEYFALQRIESRLNLEIFGNHDNEQLLDNARLKLNTFRNDLGNDYLVTSYGRITSKNLVREILNLIENNPLISVATIFQKLEHRDNKEIHSILYSLGQNGIIEVL